MGKRPLCFKMTNIRDSHMAHVSIKAAIKYFKSESGHLTGMDNFFNLQLVQSQLPVFFYKLDFYAYY